MAVAGPLDEAGVRSSVNGQILAFTDDYPTHRCTVVGWRFTRRRLLGKGVNDVHRRGGRGRYFDNFTFKVLEMGFEQCRYLNLGGA